MAHLITKFITYMGNLEHQPVHEKCSSCKRIADGVCSVYSNPSLWWEKRKQCPLASHLRKVVVDYEGKQRAGQQKQKRKKKK